MDKQSVRQFFRSVIEESGISFAELSRKIGITKTELQKYATDENVSIPVDVIAKVAIETQSPGLCYLVTTYEIERAEMWRNIKRLIKERGITQKRFLEDICLLSSDCKSGPLQQVADYFGVSTNYLLGRKEETAWTTESEN